MLLQVALFHSLWMSNIPLYICTTSSYPFLCWWTFRLLPCLGYCKQCCSEHWGSCILLDYVFFQIHAQDWDWNRVTDVENKFMDTKGGNRGGVGMAVCWIGRLGLTMYTRMCIKLMTNKNLQYKQTNKQTTNIKLCLVYLYGNTLI